MAKRGRPKKRPRTGRSVVTVTSEPDPPMDGMLGTAAAAERRMAFNLRQAAAASTSPKNRKTRSR